MSKYQILCLNIALITLSFTVSCKTYTEHTIPSKIFGTDRTISVYLPEMYTEYAPTDSVSVTYILDGHYAALRDMVNNTVNYLSQNLEVLPTICVGIHHEDRGGELSPTLDPSDNQLAQHLEKEVFPFIEKNYRTKPFRIGIGHSRGGMYLIDALSSGNELFNAYIAISPNLRYNDNMIHRKAESLLANSSAPKAFVFSSVGGQETSYFPSQNAMNEIYATHNSEDFNWNTKVYPNRSHWGTVVPTIADGLISLKQFLSLEEHEVKQIAATAKGNVLKELKEFYSRAQAWSGLDMSPSANDMNDLAYMLLNNNQAKDAEDVINWAIHTDPLNPNFLDSKGEIIEKQGRKKEAYNYFLSALELLEQEKHRISANRYQELKNIFTANIERTK